MSHCTRKEVFATVKIMVPMSNDGDDGDNGDKQWG
jgi:hypothetical protein